MLCSCGSDNDNNTFYSSGTGTIGGSSSSSSSSTIDSSSEVFNFDVAIDESFLSEADDSDASDEDFIENTNFSQTVSIEFSEGGVTYDALPSGVTATVSSGDIVIVSTTDDNIIYKLSGSSSDGMFKIYSDKKFAVELAGLTLTNEDGPAINIQSKKRSFILLDDDSENSLADGTSYADTGDEDAKGVIFSEGQMVFSGGGTLDIDANCKAGISSDQYVRFRRGNVINVVADEGNAVRGKDSLIVSGGVLNLTVSGSGNKGFKTEGPMTISGGRATVVNSAAAYYDSDEADVKGPAGINCEGDFAMTGGELYIKATGKGGKGVTADGTADISGGTIRVITTGTKYTYGSSSSSGMGGMGGMGGFGGSSSSSSSDNSKSPKGIRSEGVMTISGGDIMVRTTGGEGSEAIEGKSTMTISGGTVQAYAYDDAINSGSTMYITGGDIFVVSSSNDGLDANANMYISGGTVVAIGLGEDGIDVIENGKLYFNGGTIFSLGSTYMSSPESASSQSSITKSVSGLSSGSAVTLTNKSTSEVLFDYTMPMTVSRAYMILSVPGLAKSTSYTLAIGSSTQTVSL